MAKGRKSVTTRVNVRLTGDMRRLLDESAAQYGLSLQAEIVRRLDQSLKGEDQMQSELRGIKARIDRLEQMELFLRYRPPPSPPR